MSILARLEQLAKPLKILIAFVLLAAVGALDYLTGYEISFALFYLLPIGLATWFTDRKLGIVMALASAVVWLLADIKAGAVYSSAMVYVWNAGIRLGFFLLTVILLETGKTLERERMLGRLDYVTGAVNSRFFRDLAQRELYRAARYGYPVTLAYVDVDDFKTINDRFGHMMGDRVLHAIADGMRRHVRKTDIVARVGGDEFAILLPEVGPDAAPVVISKMQRRVSEEMRDNGWPVTFSIGVVTCASAAYSPDDVLNMADHVMYTVKRDRKNAIRYENRAR
jgi:diguanylate cyclase (GGDEF)-like protein